MNWAFVWRAMLSTKLYNTLYWLHVPRYRLRQAAGLTAHYLPPRLRNHEFLYPQTMDQNSSQLSKPRGG